MLVSLCSCRCPLELRCPVFHFAHAQSTARIGGPQLGDDEDGSWYLLFVSLECCDEGGVMRTAPAHSPSRSPPVASSIPCFRSSNATVLESITELSSIRPIIFRFSLHYHMERVLTGRIVFGGRR